MLGMTLQVLPCNTTKGIDEIWAAVMGTAFIVDLGKCVEIISGI